MKVNNKNGAVINEKESENILSKTMLCLKKSLCPDIKKCTNYHSILERRRDPLKFEIKFNLPCINAFIEGKWVNYAKCADLDKCEYFHTRNELFFDLRNYKKIYDCPMELNNGKCENIQTCAFRHIIDLDIDQLYLGQTKQEELKQLLYRYKSLIKEHQKLVEKCEKGKICLNCKSYITHQMAFFHCGHNSCMNCITLKKVNDCPFSCTGRKNKSLTENKDYTLINLANRNFDDGFYELNIGQYVNPDNLRDSFINLEGDYENINNHELLESFININ